jgi:hypothetical protein
MHGKTFLHKSFTVLTAIAIWSVYSMVALAAPGDITGEVTSTGQVTINGQPTTSGGTFVSGSTIVTGADSSAIVSLGKIGRVELGADSSLTLKFSEGSITGILNSGKAKVSNAAGVATTFATKDTTVLADAGQADSFALEVECSHTHVDGLSGLVTMRTSNSDKQVAAGTDAVAGNLNQTGCKPCMRPNSAPEVPVAGIGGGLLAVLLLAAGGGVAAALAFGRGNNDVNAGGGVVVVSPTR